MGAPGPRNGKAHGVYLEAVLTGKARKMLKNQPFGNKKTAHGAVLRLQGRLAVVPNG